MYCSLFDYFKSNHGTNDYRNSNGDVIVYSFIGYISKEVSYSGQKEINVFLDEDLVGLDEQ